MANEVIDYAVWPGVVKAGEETEVYIKQRADMPVLTADSEIGDGLKNGIIFMQMPMIHRTYL